MVPARSSGSSECWAALMVTTGRNVSSLGAWLSFLPRRIAVRVARSYKSLSAQRARSGNTQSDAALEPTRLSITRTFSRYSSSTMSRYGASIAISSCCVKLRSSGAKMLQ